MNFQELYSNFGFFNAFYADVYTAAITGETIDLQEADAVQFIVNMNSFGSAGACLAANEWRFLLQHGLASAAGVSTWSNVPLSQVIHSVEGGYASTASDGVFQIIGSISDAIFADGSGAGIFFVGYKKDVLHRYVRVYVSVTGAPSAAWIAGLAITGNNSNWPVNEPVNNV